MKRRNFLGGLLLFPLLPAIDRLRSDPKTVSLYPDPKYNGKAWVFERFDSKGNLEERQIVERIYE